LIIYQDPARGWAIKFVQKAEYCGFSTAGGSDDCGFRPGRDRKAEVLEDESVRMISEVDIFKADGAAMKLKRGCIRRILQPWLSVA